MKLSLENLSLKRYILSFLIAFLITVVLCAISGVLFSFFSPPDWLYNSFVRYFCYVSASIAAFLCVMGAQKNGLIKGIVCADIYMLMLILAGMMFFKSAFPTDSALRIFGITSVLGGIAGILGINIKK